MIDLRFVRDAVVSRASVEEIAIECGFEAVRGNGWRCCHHGDGRDRTPSASVKGNYIHCFACDRSWDVIALVREHYGFGFVEALKYLAERYFIRWPDQTPAERRKAERRFQAALPTARALVDLKLALVEKWKERRDLLFRLRSMIRRWLIERSYNTLRLPEDQRVDAFVGDPADPRLEFALDMLDRVESELETLAGGPVDLYDGVSFEDGAIRRLERMPYGELLDIVGSKEGARS